MPSFREEVYCQGISSVGPGTPNGGSTSECVDDGVGLENIAVFMGQRLVGTRGADGRRWRCGDEEDGSQNIVVGFAFMAKKMDSMSKITAISPCDGVEFHEMDFSKPPEQERRIDVILHKLSDDIMFRNLAPERDRRLRWIEDYLAQHPETAIVDPIENVAKVVSRVTMLERLQEAIARRGAVRGLPRAPRSAVLRENREAFDCGEGMNPRRQHEGSMGSTVEGVCSLAGDEKTTVAKSSLAHEVGDLQFPVICKPVEACGSRGSHTMMVVLDEAGMADVPLPIVVQEFRNHGGILYKVCVVGDDVRMFTRVSVPDLRCCGLTGSFTFDSQKPYPSLHEVRAMSGGTMMFRPQHQERQEHDQQQHANGIGKDDPSSFGAQLGALHVDRTSNPFRCGLSSMTPQGPERSGGCLSGQASVPDTATGAAVGVPKCEGARGTVRLEDAKVAAARIRETFGLSIFGFDLIIDSDTGETMMIDVNYFPSFKDLPDFPQEKEGNFGGIVTAPIRCQRRESKASRASSLDPKRSTVRRTPSAYSPVSFHEVLRRRMIEVARARKHKSCQDITP